MGFFLFISSQQLYIFITPINLLVAPPTSHIVWKIDFYQTYFCHPRSSQWWLNIDFIISWHHHWMLTGSTAQLTCTTKYIFFCYERQSIHAPHLRIFIYQFCLRSPNPALEPWESLSIQNIRYGSHNLFPHCGILISKSFCLHACVLHIQTMVTQILVQNSIIFKTWKNYLLHSNKINLSWIFTCSKLREFQDKSLVNSKINN